MVWFPLAGGRLRGKHLRPRANEVPTNCAEAVVRASASERYLGILSACGGSHTEIPSPERWALMQRWREVYAARLHATTGKWKKDGFEWHVFSFGYARSIAEAKAVVEYRAQSPSKFVVMPEDRRDLTLPAYRVIGGALPEFGGTHFDVLVSPESLTWTMAFTHEEGYCGPYFSRKEWVDGERAKMKS